MTVTIPIQAIELAPGSHMDLETYPPPDLAIESDVTSITTLDAYQSLCVPAVWLYRDRQLKIYIRLNWK
jgi:Uma2 family endonuclease